MMRCFFRSIVLGSLLAFSTSASTLAQSVQPPVKVASCDRGCPPRPTGIPDACYVEAFAAFKTVFQHPRKTLLGNPRLEALNSWAFFAFSTNDNNKTFELINALPTEAEKAQTISMIVGFDHLSGNPAQRAEFLSRVVQLVTAFKDPETKTRSLITLTERYITLKQPDAASELLTAARLSAESIKNVERRDGEWINLAKDLATLNQLDQALRIVNLITTDDNQQDALQQMAINLAQISQVQAALDLVNRLKAPDAKSHVLVAIADQYTEINDPPKALEVLAQAFQAAQLLKDDEDGHSKAGVLNAIALGYAQAGDDRKAFEVLRTIVPDRRTNDLYDFRDYYLKHQQYDQVMQVVQVMREVKDEYGIESTLTELAHHYVETGKYDQAIQIANSFVINPQEQYTGASFSSTSESREGKLGILTHLATQYAKTGQKQKAVDLFKQILQMAKKTARPTELVEIAVTYQETIGDRPTAVALIDQALQSAKNSRSRGQDFILGIIAYGYGQMKQYDQAAKVIKLIRQSQPNEADSFHDSLGSTLSSIANIAADDGQFQQGLRFAGLIMVPEEKDSALITLAYQAGETKHYDQALQIAKLIHDRPERDRLIQTLQCAKSRY